MASTSSKISLVDEFQIIKKYIRNYKSPQLIQSVGDDCSALNIKDGMLTLQCSDCLIEDVHFRRSTYSFADIAYKSLAVNISDIASMGGTPKYVHLSLGIPKETPEENLADFFSHFQDLGEAHGIQLIGGDLSQSPGPLFINVHMTGFVAHEHILYRQGFSQPSLLCVTGPLGDSAAGLYCLESKNPFFSDLIQRHKHPPIEWKEARWLAQTEKLLAMVDLSDGLICDLQQLPKVHYCINLDKVPLSESLQKLAKKENKDPYQWALAGGEDYHLLFNCKPEDFHELEEGFKNQFNKKIFCIGEVLPGEPKIQIKKNGKILENNWTPFAHFSHSKK